MRGTRKTSSNDTSWVTSDQELLDLLREGGLPAEHAGLELLLRRKPQRWEDAAGLLGSIDGASPTADDALAELVADVSSHRGHRARHRTMTNRRRVVHAVLESEEFNALLKRLPRAIRRTAEPASPGELGLIVEIVSAEDCTLTTVLAHVPRASDVTRELSRLEALAHRQLV